METHSLKIGYEASLNTKYFFAVALNTETKMRFANTSNKTEKSSSEKELRKEKVRISLQNMVNRQLKKVKEQKKTWGKSD